VTAALGLNLAASRAVSLRARDDVERNVESTGDLNQSRFVGFDVGSGDYADTARIQTGIGECDVQCGVQLIDRRPPPTSDPHRQDRRQVAHTLRPQRLPEIINLAMRHQDRCRKPGICQAPWIIDIFEVRAIRSMVDHQPTRVGKRRIDKASHQVAIHQARHRMRQRRVIGDPPATVASQQVERRKSARVAGSGDGSLSAGDHGDPARQIVRARLVPAKQGNDKPAAFIKHDNRRIDGFAGDERRNGAHRDAARHDQHQRTIVAPAGAHFVQQCDGIRRCVRRFSSEFCRYVRGGAQFRRQARCQARSCTGNGNDDGVCIHA
jgi:hypothetical protein